MIAAAYYLFSPALDAGTGDWTRGVDRPPGLPTAQIVLCCLRTDLGSYAPDPTFGVDFGVLPKGTANQGATWKAEVERALSRFVRRGVIRNLRVVVDVPRSGRLVYAVEFEDPRAPATTPARLRLVA